MNGAGAGRAGPTGAAIAALRSFVRPRPSVERCELCGAALEPTHDHLLSTRVRELRCCCRTCAMLFPGTAGAVWRYVPHRTQRLPDGALDHGPWEALGLPVDLVFVQQVAGRWIALYPGPAGAIESLLPVEAWDEMMATHPALRAIEPEVEALLVNRRQGRRDHFRVSIDQCFALTGLIRQHWSGFSGGSRVWDEVERFFDALVEGPRR